MISDDSTTICVSAPAIPALPSARYRLCSRGNGFIWAIDEEVFRSDLDLSDHEDWIYEHIRVPIGGTFIDVGGFVGTHAIRVAKECSARVIVFEPVAEHRALIAINCELNDVRLEVVPEAAGECEGAVRFQVEGPDSFVLNRSARKSDAQPRVVEVPLTTVDAIAEKLDKVHVIKIDVEGNECNVLEGATKTVARHKPKIIVEVHSHLPNCSENGNVIAQWCMRNEYSYRTIWDNGNGYFYSELMPKARRQMVVDRATVLRKLENMDRFLRSGPCGCVVEVGVYQGGSLRYLAERHTDRQFYGYDTFTGMPAVSEVDNHHKEGDFGNTSYEQVQEYLADLSNVTLIKGFYPLSDVIQPNQIALAHVDVDIYQSTIDAFEHLAPRMVKHGRIYCDDAFVSTCHGATIAFCEFCGKHRRVPVFDLETHAVVCF